MIPPNRHWLSFFRYCVSWHKYPLISLTAYNDAELIIFVLQIALVAKDAAGISYKFIGSQYTKASKTASKVKFSKFRSPSDVRYLANLPVFDRRYELK